MLRLKANKTSLYKLVAAYIVEDGGKDGFYLEDGEPPITGRVARKEEESVDLEVGFIPRNRTCAYWHQKTKRGGGYG